MQRDWRHVGIICGNLKQFLEDRILDEFAGEKKPVAGASAGAVAGYSYTIDMQQVLPSNVKKPLDTEWIRMQVADALHAFSEKVRREGNPGFTAVLKRDEKDWILNTSDTKLLFERFDEVRDSASKSAKAAVEKKSDMPIWPL